jgi:hypothetical protein
MYEKKILNILPGFMALSLVGKTSKMVPSIWDLDNGKKKNKGKKKTKKNNYNTLKGFTDIMIGVPLVKGVADIIK